MISLVSGSISTKRSPPSTRRRHRDRIAAGGATTDRRADRSAGHSGLPIDEVVAQAFQACPVRDTGGRMFRILRLALYALLVALTSTTLSAQTGTKNGE